MLHLVVLIKHFLHYGLSKLNIKITTSLLPTL